MANEAFEDTAFAPGPVPGAKDSTLLLMDAALTLLRLARTEAVQAVATLPPYLGLNFYRLPVLLLTWLSFGVLVACSVYEAGGSLAFAAGSFFLLQLALALLLEYRCRRLRQQMEFPETRKGLALLQAGLKERFGHETR